MGWGSIIYLAAITGISPDLYEAATIDGAGRLRKIWNVTLPCIRGTMVTLLIMNLGRVMGSNFERLDSFGNVQVKEFQYQLAIYIYEKGLAGGNFSRATAVGLFQSLVGLILVLTSDRVSKALGEDGLLYGGMDNLTTVPAEKKKSLFKGVNRVRVSDFAIAFVILLLSLTCIIPFIHIAAKSISSNSAVLAKQVYLWPKGLNFDAYISIFRDGQLTHAMLYTIWMTFLFTVIGLAVTVLAAYPLARRELKGRAVIAFIIMFTMYFSAGLIPEYLLYKDLKLLNTMWVLVLPLSFSPYNMLIMRSFIRSTIPDSLYEAANLDGADHFQILGRIVLPLSKPILATLALFYAVGRWNAYADAKYYITTKALQPLQYLLSNMVLNSGQDAFSLSEAAAAESTPEVLQAAVVMFATLPILVVYPFVQKYFVQGTMIGAVKG